MCNLCTSHQSGCDQSAVPWSKDASEIVPPMPGVFPGYREQPILIRNSSQLRRCGVPTSAPAGAFDKHHVAYFVERGSESCCMSAPSNDEKRDCLGCTAKRAV